MVGTFLAIQWLRLRASTAGRMGSIPGWGTKIPHAAAKKKKKKMVYVGLVGEGTAGPGSPTAVRLAPSSVCWAQCSAFSE